VQVNHYASIEVQAGQRMRQGAEQDIFKQIFKKNEAFLMLSAQPSHITFYPIINVWRHTISKRLSAHGDIMRTVKNRRI
jgi:hypothetical protein